MPPDGTALGSDLRESAAAPSAAATSAPFLTRREPRAHALDYLRGLLAGLPRFELLDDGRTRREDTFSY